MKKIISVILALTLSLSLLAACKKPSEGSLGDNSLPEIKTADEVREFKNAEGRVAYQVEYSIPDLTTDICSEFAAKFINDYINEFYLSPAFNFAEINVQNFRSEEKEPRKITLTHEIKYRTNDVLSVVFKTSYSKASSVIEARTFDLREGSVISFDRLLNGTDSSAKENVLLCIKDDAKTGFTDAPLTDEQLAELDSAFDPVNFWFSDSGITFVFNKSSVISGLGATSGIYEYLLDWSWAYPLGLISSPEELFTEATTA